MKKVKIRFCPKCKSTNIEKDLEVLPTKFGIQLDWICKDCGFKAAEFPQKEVKSINKK